MLYSYKFIDHKINKLNVYIYLFIRNLYFNNPTLFSTSLFVSELQKKINRSKILRQLFKSFFDDFVSLNDTERDNLYFAFLRTNEISVQCSDNNKCFHLVDLPARIQESTHTLFLYLYEHTLKSFDVKNHYQEFYSTLKIKVCPFCGLEILLNPQHYKQDYDHYLFKSHYPFSSVNMRNLVPMGRDCNSIFKKTNDILYRNGIRRKAIYPYSPNNNTKIQIDLNGSELPNINNKNGNWSISLKPNSDEINTWADVFNISERYKVYGFQEYAQTWLENFIKIVRIEKTPGINIDTEYIKQKLSTFVSIYNSDDYADKNFLRHAFYKEIYNSADEEFYKSLINRL